MDTMTTKGLPSLPPVIITLVVGLGVGLIGGYFIPRKAPAATKTPQTQQQQVAQNPSQPQERGFYGMILSRNGSSLSVQELISKDKKGEHTFTVNTTPQTQLTHQKPNAKDGATQKLPIFTPEPGTIEGLTKDVYVYISTKDALGTNQIAATQIIYSEKSPFKE